MVKKLIKVGNSHALVLDKAIMDLVGLGEGDEVQVTVHDRAITVTPAHRIADDKTFNEAMEDVLDKHGEALRRLA